jgi:putative ABC transport system permease protein
MFKSFFTVAIRHFARQRLYTLANLVGLSIGLTCILLIWLYIAHETSFDTFLPGAERTYRVLRQITTPYKMNFHVDTHAALTPLVQQAIPEIESVNRIRPGARWVQYGEYAQRRTFWFTDTNYLSFWGFKLKKGDPQTALMQRGSVVISQEAIAEFFHTEDPMGKTITAEDGDYVITGILDEQPHNSHFRVFFVTATLPTRSKGAWQNWETPSGFRWVQTFVRLREDANPGRAEEKLRALTFPESDPEITTNHRMQKLTRMHLCGLADFPAGIDGPGSGIAAGDLKVVRSLGFVGILLLMVASINFVNLSTARATLRAKEVGIRKVVGANRALLAAQFLVESVLLTFMSLPICFLLTSLLLPYWQQIVGRSGSLTAFFEPAMFLTLTGATLCVGLLSGVYPAILLSGFSPIKALHTRSFSSTGSAYLRKVLVVFQLWS